MADDNKLRRACDRCHSIKERCQWLPGSDTCQRCARLHHECLTLRPIQKLGRKPRERPGSASATNNPQARPSTSYTTGSSSTTSGERHEGSQISAGGVSRTSTRPIPEDKLRELTTSDGVDEIEKELLNICFHDTDAAGQWTLGPTFCKRHAEDLFYRLKNAVPQLKDAFISVASLMSAHSNNRVSELVQQICISKAALSVSALRELEVNGREDVATVLVLALIISTFGLFVADGDSAGVCAYALNDIRVYYESPDVVFTPDEHAYLICLFYTELIECVPHSRLPTMKYGTYGKAARHVDRYMGLAAPFMAFFYELCEFAQELRLNRGVNDQSLWRKADDLEYRIRTWTPTHPEGFPDQYAQIELIQIFAQIKSLRQAALLVLHRLRYPYGIQDEKGLAIADSIVTENSLVLQFSDRGAAMGMDLAYLIACLELRDVVDQEATLVQISTHMRFSEPTRVKFLAQLQQVWQAKHAYSGLYWYDLSSYMIVRRQSDLST